MRVWQLLMYTDVYSGCSLSSDHYSAVTRGYYLIIKSALPQAAETAETKPNTDIYILEIRQDTIGVIRSC